MIFRRIKAHIEKENWFAVFMDFAIVVIGVFVGLQVANWNEARISAESRTQIIDALITNLSDSIDVQDRFTVTIETSLSNWRKAYERGDKPIPYYYRIDGSDTAPDTWSTVEQMQITDMFDPVTLFDLTYYYSELEGVGRKYIRYVTFVENQVLPGKISGQDYFYNTDGKIKPEFLSNMERLREFSEEVQAQTEWAKCLIYRLEAKRLFDQTCRRARYTLDGMAGPEINSEAAR